MPRKTQTQAELTDILQKATPEQRELARRMTFNVQRCFRSGALLAEREVLEALEAMIIQAAGERVE